MNNSIKQKPKVLVADDVESLARLMKYLLVQKGYEVEVAEDGEQCLEMIRSFKPDLVILDIMMPRLHGLDALKKIKANPETKGAGVIICSSKSYKPDQEQAKELGIFDFIVKPFQREDFLRKVENYFSGFSSVIGSGPEVEPEKEVPAEDKFFPKIESSRSRYHLWGTRGSIPVSGQRYLHHGGNTSCISFEAGEEIIIFDAGTGIRELGAILAKQKPRKLNIFIGHTHWDHIQGFPFFAPAYIPGFEIMIYGASGFGKELKSIIKGQLDKDYFPVQMEDMRAAIEFRHLSESPLEIGDFKIYWTFTHHPGATLGFKIEIENQKIAYISDNEFLKGYLGHPGKITARSEILVPYQKLVDFLADADMLIGEAQYTNEEYQHKIGWGHSSLSNACVLAKLAGIRKWIVVHHDPAYDDDFLQDKMNLHRQILKELGHTVELYDGFDGRIQYL